MTNSYIDAGGVYRNRLGITDAGQLRRAEYRLTALRSREILEQNVLGQPQDFGLERLKTIHHHLFQDVYEWAGKLRTVSSAKRMGDGMASVFANPDTVEKSWRALEQKTIAFASAKGQAFEQKRDALADIFIEANRIHPFPEGNGRSLQVFMKELAKTQNIILDYSKTNAKEWNKASAISGLHGDLIEDDKGKYLIPHLSSPEPIRKIFAEMAQPSRFHEKQQNPEIKPLNQKKPRIQKHAIEEPERER